LSQSSGLRGRPPERPSRLSAVSTAEAESPQSIRLYDFRRPDRIPKDQLRAIYLLHENFARNVASSLSAYLRAYLSVELVTVEQLAFVEFTQCLPSPTHMVSLSMKPFDGNAVLEINPSLVFPMLEVVLGGTGKSAVPLNREVTEIERSVLDSIIRIIIHDLREAWQSVSPVAFSVEGHESEPQLLRILAPNEAVVAISLEMRLGENVGMMNLGIPSITVKMLRQKFDQQWSLRRSGNNEEEQRRLLNLLRESLLLLDASLGAGNVRLSDLLNLRVGDVLAFDYPVQRPVALEVNGCRRFDGWVVSDGRKRAFQIEKATPADQGHRIERRPLRSLIADHR
jgi:flagellar motor switch protein FliM